MLKIDDQTMVIGTVDAERYAFIKKALAKGHEPALKRVNQLLAFTANLFEAGYQKEEILEGIKAGHGSDWAQAVREVLEAARIN